MVNLFDNFIIRYGLNRIANEVGFLKKISPQLFRGLSVSLTSLSSAIFSSKNLASLWTAENVQFGIIFILTTLVLYAIGAVLMITIFSPVALLLLFLAPNILLQIFLFTIPHLAYNISLSFAENKFENSFIDEYDKLNPQRRISEHLKVADIAASRWEATGSSFWSPLSWFSTGTPSTSSAIPVRSGYRYRSYRRKGFLRRILSGGPFTLRSFRSLLVGFVPIVGPVYTFIYQSADLGLTITVDTLQSYFDSLALSTKERQNIINQHYYEFIGFALPFALLSMVPIVGGLAQILTPTAGAHLVYRLFDTTDRSKEISRDTDRSKEIPADEKMKTYESSSSAIPPVPSVSMTGEMTQEQSSTSVSSLDKGSGLPTTKGTETVDAKEYQRTEANLNKWFNSFYRTVDHGLEWVGTEKVVRQD